MENWKIKSLVESRWFQAFVIAVILLNSVVFGLQTSQGLMERFGRTLNLFDQFCLGVFTVELVLKIIVYNKRFCHDPWNIFDFIIVAVSFVPDMGMFSALRLFRVLRVFKLISGVRPLRVILSAVIRSIPGVMWASVILLLVYYVYGIIGTNLFGKTHPQWFGTLGGSVYSLFQIMTLESWSMGIARPVIEVHPYAWIYFVSYILFSSFVVMNIVVGIVLTSISDSVKKEDETDGSLDSVRSEFEKLKKQMEQFEKALGCMSDQKEKKTARAGKRC